MTKIPAQELDRIIQNVLLFSDKKALRLNEVLLSFTPDTVHAYSCDDYVAVSDSLTYSDGFNKEFCLTVSDAELLGEWIKKDRKTVHKYDIIIRPRFTGLIFECEETSSEDGSDKLFFEYGEPNEQAWKLVKILLDTSATEVSYYGFAIRPERLTKMSRFKAHKDAPIDLRGVDINDHLIVQFRRGDTLVGAIMPVRREVIREEFLWKNSIEA